MNADPLAFPPRDPPHGKTLPLTRRQLLILRVLDRRTGVTVVQITSLLIPFYPAANPPSQLSVRQDIRALFAIGQVSVAHTGKPRTYVRAGKRRQHQPPAV